MLIGFIGCPCSGKTTTAAGVFADLKLMGTQSEFIPEQARIFIAQKLREGSKSLSDIDQVSIWNRQEEVESLLVSASDPEAVVVTDSCVLNSMLYIKNLEDKMIKDMSNSLNRYDLLFYCSPVKRSKAQDSLRIHSEHESLAVDRKIPDLVKLFNLQVVILSPDPDKRHHEVIKTILERKRA